MTDLEIQQGVCQVQSRFNELLYEFADNQTDSIPNLSDLKKDNETGAANAYDPTTSYDTGMICSYEHYMYISLVPGNIGDRPDISHLAWKKIETKTLDVGDVYVSAFVELSFGTDTGIEDSFNISSVVDQGDDYLQINFEGNAGIWNTNYQVFYVANGGQLGPEGYNINVINVVFKHTEYMTIKVPAGKAYVRGAKIMIVPQQNADIF